MLDVLQTTDVYMAIGLIGTFTYVFKYTLLSLGWRSHAVADRKFQSARAHDPVVLLFMSLWAIDQPLRRRLTIRKSPPPLNHAVLLRTTPEWRRVPRMAQRRRKVR